MRASAVSFAHKLAAAVLAALLTFTLVPFAHAEGEETGEVDAGTVASGSPDQSNDSTDSLGEPQEASAEQDAEGSPVAPMLASGLVGKPNSFINSDVILDSEPVIGSFTVDGLTFAVAEGSAVELVGVAGAEGAFGSRGSEAKQVPLGAASPQPLSAPTPEAANLVLPETVSYEGTNYTLASIAPYAFYLSGVTSVTLPKSVSDVDDRAFRSSDVASVAVAEGNPTYSSFDGALYDADQLSLLLIPEGKQGTVRIPKTAEVAEASVFSHCPLVDSISVDAGSAAFASENGLLYTSDLTTLLRVPAGATETTIREGCATIAAGALEACAELTTINAPATVTSISLDVFHAIPTVSLPATALVEGAYQLTALVALSSADGDCFDVDTSAITVVLPDEADASPWRAAETSVVRGMQEASKALLSGAETYAATSTVTINMNGGDAYVNEAGARKSVHTTTNDYAVILRGGTAWHNSGTPTILSDVKRSGYSFAGWSTNKSSNPLTAGSIVRYASEGALTVYAIWSPLVTINMNGGTGFFTDGGTGTWKSSHQTVNNYAVVCRGGAVWHNSNSSASDMIMGSNQRAGYTMAGWSESSSTAASDASYEISPTWDKGPKTIYAIWKANTITCKWDSQGGNAIANTSASYSSTAKVPIPSGNPTKAGYTFAGWYTAASGGNPVSSTTSLPTSDATYYAHWSANTITCKWNSQGGSAVADTSDVYAPEKKVPLPAADPERAGYTFAGWYTDPSGGTVVLSSTSLPTADTTYYAHWTLVYYDIHYELDGGNDPNNPTVYNAETATFTLKSPIKQGYTFTGWSGTGLSGSANKTVTIAKGSVGDRTYTAHWEPALSADVPLEVDVRVDVLGIEEQTPATGYIESRCGEPLKVARVDLTPLDGAKELFGAGNVADVFLEVLANDGASPNARFSLGASATESDASKLQAFTMASYGTRIPISYRFAMPPEVQTSLVEYADPQPVCSVAYTVALV